MKKLTLLLLTALLTCTAATSNAIIGTHGDTLIIARDSDTLKLTQAQVLKHLSTVLDDTIIDMKDLSGADAAQWHDTAIDSQRIWADWLENITYASVWGVVTLIALIMLFNYLKRRRKYKMVEKAIENNYPLPPYVFEGQVPTQANWQPAYGQPVQGTPIAEAVDSPPTPTVDENGQPVPPPFNVQSDPWRGNTANAAPRMNWRTFNHCLVLIAVGVGFILFFNSHTLTGIGVIMALIGLGKGFIEYIEQRDAINAWRNNNQ